MDTSTLLQLLPNLETVAWELPGSVSTIADPGQHYRSLRVYTGQSDLQPDILYLLRPDSPATFPSDRFCSVSATAKTGGANHLYCPQHTPDAIWEAVLNLFDRLRQQENLIDRLVYQSAGLQALCELGSQLLENPVYIHDDWFMMVARSSQVDEIMPPEYVMSSNQGYVPRVVVEDFQHDSDYLETYRHRSARIWENAQDGGRCIYANLWEGTIYRGRLLVIESNHPICPADLLIADVLTQRAMTMMRSRHPGGESQQRSMDDVVYDLLQGAQPDPADLSQLMSMLSWNKEDSFFCVHARSQLRSSTALSEHLLHNDLFRDFPHCYILLAEHRQYIIWNQTRDPITLPQVRHKLAAICRDHCLYVGISSPVSGIRDLHAAAAQAQIALDHAFRLKSDKWIIAFSDCTLDYLTDRLTTPLQPKHLVSPSLRLLQDCDARDGTQYFDTLREFLLLERSIPATAEKLIIHRTTLLYRLKKIQSILRLDLDDPWQRLDLLISLWILEHKET